MAVAHRAPTPGAIVTVAVVGLTSLDDANAIQLELQQRPGFRLVYAKVAAGKLMIVPEESIFNGERHADGWPG
jgi:hypothetical protein